jgi:hypothetical protein
MYTQPVATEQPCPAHWPAALKRVQLAICKEQVRYYLGGVLLRRSEEHLL